MPRPAPFFAALLLAAGATTPAFAQSAPQPAPQTPTTSAAQEQKKLLSIGDAAPALKVEKFLKGDPVTEFKAGHIYVVEFWATWCGPCKRAMPHLSELQKKYQDKVTFISVNIWERKPKSGTILENVESFVKGNSANMEYTIAFDGAAAQTDKAYMKAAGQDGIPAAFIITGDQKIAYIGHPMEPAFESTLKDLVAGKFDLAAAQKQQQEAAAAEAQQAAIQQKVMELDTAASAALKADDIDGALAKYDEIAKLMPEAKLRIQFIKFRALFETGRLDRAYAFAQEAIDGPGKDDAEFLNEVAWTIVDPKANVKTRNTDLAMKAAQRAADLTKNTEPAVLDTLARCHFVKGDKAKAIELQTKVVELFADDKDSAAEAQKVLDEYKNDAR